jgi:hypothetical protein
MTPLTKNLLVVLGVFTVGYAGYYLYTQQSTLTLDGGSENDAVYMNILANTEVFIVRSQELSSIDLDLAVLDDVRFRSLRRFTKDVEDQPIGRDNPFAEAESVPFISSDTE